MCSRMVWHWPKKVMHIARPICKCEHQDPWLAHIYYKYTIYDTYYTPIYTTYTIYNIYARSTMHIIYKLMGRFVRHMFFTRSVLYRAWYIYKAGCCHGRIP
jgi:hypothetical protein